MRWRGRNIAAEKRPQKTVPTEYSLRWTMFSWRDLRRTPSGSILLIVTLVRSHEIRTFIANRKPLILLTPQFGNSGVISLHSSSRSSSDMGVWRGTSSLKSKTAILLSIVCKLTDIIVAISMALKPNSSREKKAFAIAKVNSRCFHSFPAAILEPLRGTPSWRVHT